MNHPEVTVTKEKLNRILGLAIGDGHINKDGRLCLSHSIKQKDYLLYKYNLLKDMGFNPSKPKIIEQHLKGRNKTYYIISTYCYHPSFKKLRKKLYPNGIKTIRIPVLSNLTIQDLAIWYLDNGGVQRTGGGSKNHKGGKKLIGIKLSTDVFSYDEQLIIIKILRRKFGLNPIIHRKRKTYYLYFSLPNAIKLVDLCYPYFKEIPSLKYKWYPFYISDAEQRVQDDSECLSDRELKTRLFVKYYKFPKLDKNQDKQLIVKYYGSIDKFNEALIFSRRIHDKEESKI